MRTKRATTGRRSDSSPGTASGPSTNTKRRLLDDRRSMIWLAGVGLALIAVIAVVIAVATNDDDESAAAPLVLSVGDGGAAGSCLPFSVETLAGMPLAFAGTVTAADSDSVTIEVDRWYRGGDATVVELTTIADAQALLGGFSYVVGSQYLVSASDGALSYCGYSGPATPELEASFDTAFAG